MQEKVNTVKDEALKAVAQATDDAGLQAIKVQYLGKKGAITTLMKLMKNIAADERRDFGKKVNDAKNAVEEAMEARSLKLSESKYDDVA